MITRTDLERWADRPDSKADFPLLVSRLIWASTPVSTRINIPIGNSINISGWDGVVVCEADTGYVSKGRSLWEFGTESNPRRQAEENYSKRTQNSLDYEKSQCIFIFCTLRLWKKKTEWVNEKIKKNDWREVIVYDSSDFEQWIEKSIPVLAWLEDRIGISSNNGHLTVDEYWNEWSTGPNGITLLPNVLTCGREYVMEKLLAFLTSVAGIRAVRASTKNEATAFIIATMKLSSFAESERFLSRTLIIEDVGNFRYYYKKSLQYSLNLIARFEDASPLFSAVSAGHHVLVPLGAGDDFNQEIYDLPTLDRDGLINSLYGSGVNREEAEYVSRESARNITIAKKLLKFPNFRTPWLIVDSIEQLIPAIIVGRWDESYKGDKEIIEILSGKKYEEFKLTISRWLNVPEAPILQIGSMWRLTSPLDIWSSLSEKIAYYNKDRVLQCIFAVLENRTNISNRNYIGLFSINQEKYSGWMRSGLCQFLILFSRRYIHSSGELNNDAREFVDYAVNRLIFQADSSLWISLNDVLPLLAEASPNVIVRVIEGSLSKENSEIMSMFEGRETDLYLNNSVNHTGLLWAMEGLAWIPDYLLKASVILTKLARLDPGGNVLNRPINSLTRIFKPWYYQTYATFEDRMEVLRQVANLDTKVGWNLLLKLCPRMHDIGENNYKLRWVGFEYSRQIIYNNEEVYNTYSIIRQLLLEIFDFSDQSLVDLLEVSTRFDRKNRHIILESISQLLYRFETLMEYSSWEKSRNILANHRRYSTADWALPESELFYYSKIEEALRPKDLVIRYRWLFDEVFPAFFNKMDTSNRDNDAIYISILLEERIRTAKEIVNLLSFERAVGLAQVYSQPAVWGDVLAQIDISIADIMYAYSCFGRANKFDYFSLGFFRRCFLNLGFDAFIDIMSEVIYNQTNSRSIGMLLLTADPEVKLWQFVDSIGNEVPYYYWRAVDLRLVDVENVDMRFVCEKLISVEKVLDSIPFVSLNSNIIDTDILILFLKTNLKSIHFVKSRKMAHYIQNIFTDLYRREDLDLEDLIYLEWNYIGIFDSDWMKYNLNALQDKLAVDPVFFNLLLKWIYPRDLESEPSNPGDNSADFLQLRSIHSFELLQNWVKIPGMLEKHTIDKNQLENWIDICFNIAKRNERLEQAEYHVAKVLAEYPEDSQYWPEENILRVIELYGSENFLSSYESALFNKRGFSVRGVFDGGDIERAHADDFLKLATKFAREFPKVAAIFRALSEKYLSDALMMDQRSERDSLEF